MMLYLQLITWPRFRGAYLAILCIFALASCQDDVVQPTYYGTITGTVLDGRTNLPLANAAVSTNPATSSYVTNAQGKFQISDVPAGRVSITASKADYQQVMASVTVSNGQAADVTLQLTKASAVTLGAPTRPSPADHATGVSTSLKLSWRPPVNSVSGDSLRYDVQLYEGSSASSTTILTNSRDSSVTVSNLKYNTFYFWQVTVRNPANLKAQSALWSFQTGSITENRFLFLRTNGNNTDIYAADNLGANPVVLNKSAGIKKAPRLSPDRTLIAYTSNVGGFWGLYVMDRDGMNQHPVPNTNTSSTDVDGINNRGIGYCWSPDGSRLLYSHNDKLYSIDRNGFNRVTVATAPNGKHFRECDWTGENGGHIIAQVVGVDIYDSAFYLYDGMGNPQGPQPFVSTNQRRLDSPSFSPNGRSIVYSQDVSVGSPPSNVGRQFDAHIFIKQLDNSGTVDVSTGIAGTVTNNTKAKGTNDLFPRFSSTEARLVFVNRENDDVSPPQVWTSNTDGSNRKMLFDNADMPDLK